MKLTIQSIRRNLIYPKLKSNIFLAFLLFSLLVQAQIPNLDNSSGTTRLLVDGKPFLILGGELHNSTGSDIGHLEVALSDLKALNLNTVLGYAYWEMIEPEEGVYNFDLVDALLDGARKNRLKVILVWFGSWKSTASSYVPEWVKTQPERFERYTLQDGTTLEMLSPFSEANRDADAKAYVALMRHLRRVDKDHTVIMTQVENEPGCFENYRDFSAAGQQAWEAPMPAPMMDYLKAGKGNLFPELEQAWAAQGYPTQGTWADVLGPGKTMGPYPKYTEELFMAYSYSKYINYIASLGRKELDLPAFSNGWLYNPSGFYPHGTVNPHVLDAYRAGGNALDFYSPNVYTIDYDPLFTQYTARGNTLFIPESLLAPAAAIYSIAQYDALGFAPFGIDGDRVKNPNNADQVTLLQQTYGGLSDMTPLVSENLGKSSMQGVYLYPLRTTQEIQMGDYVLKATDSRSGGFSVDFGKSLEQWGKSGPPGMPSGTNSSPELEAMPAGPFGPIPKKLGAAMVIHTGADEFIIAGYGVKFGFEVKPGVTYSHLGLLAIDEGNFKGGRFTPTKRWNGDEQKISLPPDQFTILRVKLYRN